MTLSVVCPTRDPGPQVAATLSQLRGVADEIVVAADSRVNPDRLGEYAAVADRIYRFEYTGLERTFAWLHRRCSCDWVLLIAGDEVASPALISQLPELIQERDVLQYFIPTRWLFPDANHWLYEVPWYPDYHNRLVRNDGTLWFSGIKHTHAAPVRPARYLEAPLYHLNLVLQSFDERFAKVKQYETARPGLQAPGGGPLNATYYLPEYSSKLPPEPVPREDQAAIMAVLTASAKRCNTLLNVPLATGAEIEKFWNGRTLDPDTYRAAIVPLERDRRMYAGECRTFSVRVTNRGREYWPWGTDQLPMIRVSYHWRDSSGGTLIWDGHRTPLPMSVFPGKSCVVPIIITAPSFAGRFVLEIDLVHEYVRWFDCPLQIEMQVGAEITSTPNPPRAANKAGVSRPKGWMARLSRSLSRARSKASS